MEYKIRIPFNYDAENINVIQAAGAAAILNPGGAFQAGADFLNHAITLPADELQKFLDLRMQKIL